MTCYDLRFPELARALTVAGAEALLVPAAWVAGERKVEHWRTLLRARAIENTVWVVGVGQPGPRYSGHSIVVAPDGDVVVEAGEDADRARRRARPGARSPRSGVPTPRWPTGGCERGRQRSVVRRPRSHDVAGSRLLCSWRGAGVAYRNRLESGRWQQCQPRVRIPPPLPAAGYSEPPSSRATES